MVAYEGEAILDVNLSYSGNSIYVIILAGYALPIITVNDDNTIFHQPISGWCSEMDSRVTITNHYHKRGWRTESDDYVEWDSTGRNDPYPGGGTVEPVVGTVVFQWVTYSNGQLPT